MMSYRRFLLLIIVVVPNLAINERNPLCEFSVQDDGINPPKVICKANNPNIRMGNFLPIECVLGYTKIINNNRIEEHNIGCTPVLRREFNSSTEGTIIAERSLNSSRNDLCDIITGYEPSLSLTTIKCKSECAKHAFAKFGDNCIDRPSYQRLRCENIYEIINDIKIYRECRAVLVPKTKEGKMEIM